MPRMLRAVALVKLLTALAQVIYVAVSAWQRWRASRRTADVRDHPLAEWVRKLGGKDERPTSGSKDTRSDSDE